MKSRIREARARASLAVNGELIGLYWRVGRDILEREDRDGCGARVVDHLAVDLRGEFLGMRGFSRAARYSWLRRGLPRSRAADRHGYVPVRFPAGRGRCQERDLERTLLARVKAVLLETGNGPSNGLFRWGER